MTYTLSLPNTSANILLPPLSHFSNPQSAQRQQTIARLAKRIETWSYNYRAQQGQDMVRKHSLSLDTDNVPSLQDPFGAMDLDSDTQDEHPTSPTASQSSITSWSDVRTPPSDRNITAREAELLANLRRPDHVLIEMGHATLRNLIWEARTKLAEIEAHLSATTTTEAQSEYQSHHSTSSNNNTEDEDAALETKLQELRSLLTDFDRKLRTWTDVITGGDGFDGIGSIGSTREEMEADGIINAFDADAVMPPGVREPRIELLHLRSEREELGLGAEAVLERRNERRRLGERVEGWLKEMGT